jgi:hypothetical protein
MFLSQPAPKTVEDLRQEISEDSLLELLEKQQALRVSCHSRSMWALLRLQQQHGALPTMRRWLHCFLEQWLCACYAFFITWLYHGCVACTAWWEVPLCAGQLWHLLATAVALSRGAMLFAAECQALLAGGGDSDAQLRRLGGWCATTGHSSGQ